jgi:thiamine-monophosphate kinase
MSKQQTGEDALVARLRRLLPPDDVSVIEGIGDDCAAVRVVGAGFLALLKTDCVVEGRHFSPKDAPADVGWKAACRAVSDIAASGGVPRHALVTCVLRRGCEGRWVEGVYRGLARAARRYGFTVVGGELAATEGPNVINVAMNGNVRRREHVTRRGGRPGDVLLVTGALGGSFASGRHLRFVPRLEEARWLVEGHRPHAMMDLSDGLAADVPRLAAASGCGYEIDAASVPRSRGATLEQALSEGEDFELLLAVAPRAVARLQAGWLKKFPRLRLTEIGCLAERGVARGFGSQRGFDHFTR